MTISIEKLSDGQWGFQDADNQSLPELGTYDNKADAEHHMDIHNDGLLSKKGQ